MLWGGEGSGRVPLAVKMTEFLVYFFAQAHLYSIEEYPQQTPSQVHYAETPLTTTHCKHAVFLHTYAGSGTV